jgi:hypothetical protein
MIPVSNRQAPVWCRHPSRGQGCGPIFSPERTRPSAVTRPSYMQRGVPVRPSTGVADGVTFPTELRLSVLALRVGSWQRRSGGHRLWPSCDRTLASRDGCRPGSPVPMRSTMPLVAVWRAGADSHQPSTASGRGDQGRPRAVAGIRGSTVGLRPRIRGWAGWRSSAPES